MCAGVLAAGEAVRRCCKQEEQSPAQPSPARPHLPPRGAAHQPSPPPRAQPQHTRYLWTDIWTLAGVVRAGDAAPCPANCCSVPASAVGGAGLCSGRCSRGGARVGCPGVPPPAVWRVAAPRRDPCVRTGAAQLCTADRRPEHARHHHHLNTSTSISCRSFTFSQLYFVFEMPLN